MAAGALFAEGVRAVLGGWAALQLALTHGFGGPHGPEKLRWLEGALGDFLQRNAALQQDEVEEFLAEVMDNEFDTMVEDGSLQEVSRQLLSVAAAASRGDAVAVGAAVAALSRRAPAIRAAVAASRRGGGGDDGDVGDSGDSGDRDDRDGGGAPPHDGAGGPPGGDGRGDGAESGGETEEMDVSPPPDPGGWTLVQRRRR